MVELPALSFVDQYPLSPMQQGMLFHSLDAPRSGVNVEHVLCTLTEPLDVGRFVEAWEQVIASHDVLRTSFDWEQRREPVQNVHESVRLPVQVIDWEHLPASEQERRLAAVINEDRARGFDLRNAPLMRLVIVRRGPGAFEVLWSFHHAILDGRSFPIVLREVFGLYDRGPVGDGQDRPTAPRQYRAHIDWLQGLDADRSKAFWQQRLAGFRAPTPL